jgi:hypothetical protein
MMCNSEVALAFSGWLINVSLKAWHCDREETSSFCQQHLFFTSSVPFKSSLTDLVSQLNTETIHSQG